MVVLTREEMCVVALVVHCACSGVEIAEEMCVVLTLSQKRQRGERRRFACGRCADDHVRGYVAVCVCMYGCVCVDVYIYTHICIYTVRVWALRG
jgi:hypothetical protein